MSEVKHAPRQTLVDEGTEFKGSLTSTCPIVVRGRMEGDIQAPALEVQGSGAVHGRAQVGTLTVQGELAGEFDADTLELSGTVHDKTVIRAKTLSVKLDTVLGKPQGMFGECDLSVGDPPPKADE